MVRCIQSISDFLEWWGLGLLGPGAVSLPQTWGPQLAEMLRHPCRRMCLTMGTVLSPVRGKMALARRGVTTDSRQRGLWNKDPWGFVLGCPEPRCCSGSACCVGGQSPAGVAVTGGLCLRPSSLRPQSLVSLQLMVSTQARGQEGGHQSSGPGRA